VRKPLPWRRFREDKSETLSERIAKDALYVLDNEFAALKKLDHQSIPKTYEVEYFEQNGVCQGHLHVEYVEGQQSTMRY